MSDTLEIFGDEFTNVTGIKATDNNNQIKTYIRPQRTKSITQNGTGIDVTNYASVDVSVSGGGGDTWTWMGKNPTKLRTCLNEKVYLKDTGYATWTPSTSSSSIVSPKNLTSFDVTVSEGDYILWYRFHAHFEYGSGATNNAKPTDYYWVRACILYGVRNSLSDMTNDTFSSSGMTGIAQYGGFDYYNSSGVLEYTPSALYTVYPSAWTFAQTSFSNNRLNISPVTATISARCNNTYFSTTNASAVDKDASYFEQVMEAWQVDVGTSVFGGEGNEVHDMWLDGYII